MSTLTRDGMSGPAFSVYIPLRYLFAHSFSLHLNPSLLRLRGVTSAPFLFSHNGRVWLCKFAFDWLHGVPIKIKPNSCLHTFSAGPTAFCCPAHHTQLSFLLLWDSRCCLNREDMIRVLTASCVGQPSPEPTALTPLLRRAKNHTLT